MYSCIIPRVLSAVAVSALCMTSAATAYADPIQINGSYTVGYSKSISSQNQPTFSPYSLPLSFTEILSTGISTGQLGFFTINPSGSCGTGGTCSSNIQSGTITVTFSFTEAVSGATATLTETGTYQAKYSGSFLSCSGKSGTGQSDCIDWGTTTLASQTDDRLVTFTNGDVLDVTFYNAQDWSIAPKISFLERISSHDTPIPLPGTLPLFASGLGALGLLGWRRKRKGQAV